MNDDEEIYFKSRFNFSWWCSIAISYPLPQNVVLSSFPRMHLLEIWNPFARIFRNIPEIGWNESCWKLFVNLFKTNFNLKVYSKNVLLLYLIFCYRLHISVTNCATNRFGFLIILPRGDVINKLINTFASQHSLKIFLLISHFVKVFFSSSFDPRVSDAKFGAIVVATNINDHSKCEILFTNRLCN